MMREQKIERVVFALRISHIGGYAPVFTSPPSVIVGVLEKEEAEQYEKSGWTIHRV
jgi:hypothetical protein